MKHQLLQAVEELKGQILEITPALNIPQKQVSLATLEKQIESSALWEDPTSAQHILKKYSSLKEEVDFWTTVPNKIKEVSELLAETDDSNEQDLLTIQREITTLEESVKAMKIQVLFTGPHDEQGCLLALHAGAGGTDAQDWTEILYRMYLRFSEQKGWKVELVEMHKGAEAGIKSILIQISGEHAYGFLKAEAGVHRLVRLSPFNPKHTRETSFALVEALPVLEQKETGILKPEDLKIEATTASGHGGQSVNTTYSAIRITHIPTGIKVSIQNERSQHQNKEIALQVLSARLKLIEDAELQKEKEALRGEFKSAEWGNQIRSYVLHPYQLVKDHRTDHETTDTQGVLDGALDDFIMRYLEKNIQSKT